MTGRGWVLIWSAGGEAGWVLIWSAGGEAGWLRSERDEITISHE